jgi:hypothetical protein
MIDRCQPCQLQGDLTMTQIGEARLLPKKSKPYALTVRALSQAPPAAHAARLESDWTTIRSIDKQR